MEWQAFKTCSPASANFSWHLANQLRLHFPASLANWCGQKRSSHQQDVSGNDDEHFQALVLIHWACTPLLSRVHQRYMEITSEDSRATLAAWVP